MIVTSCQTSFLYNFLCETTLLPFRLPFRVSAYRLSQLPVAMATDVSCGHYKVKLSSNEYQTSDKVHHLCVSANPRIGYCYYCSIIGLTKDDLSCPLSAPDCCPYYGNELLGRDMSALQPCWPLKREPLLAYECTTPPASRGLGYPFWLA